MPDRFVKTACVLLTALLLCGCLSRQGASSAPESASSQPASSAAPQPDDSTTPGSQSAPSGSDPAALATFTLTIPEGFTLARVGMTLEEAGICTAAEFIEAAQTGDYGEFSLVAQQAPNENRCFNLEGYLAPNTYEFYANATADEIIRRLLGQTETEFDDALRAQVAASGYTVDEILTLASMIEKEAFGTEVMPMISSVFHNRLGIGMPLQSDPTITYVEGAIKPFITGDVDRYNEYYNTYKCPALPAGAICNPSLPAIQAALNPAQSDYVYFVTDADKNYYWGVTWEDHEANIEAAGL